MKEQREMIRLALVQRAKEARKKAYCPYSGFAVGAALLCADGSVYDGCNIENAGFTATCCAERTAFFRAVNDARKALHDEGFEARRMGPSEVKRMLALYFEASMTGDQIPDVEGSENFDLTKLRGATL